MRRAIRDDQKELRRQAILEVAWSLFKEQPYEAINMQEVAAQSGLAKGTLYLYFQTKEELFLEVLEQQFEGWMEEINGSLAQLPQPSPPEMVVETFSHALGEHPALLRLLAMSHSILEQNVSLDAVIRFKASTYSRLDKIGSHLERLLPQLKAGEGALFLLYGNALIIGLYGMANPAPKVAEALASIPTLNHFQLDFSHHFQTGMLALLRGWSP
jgi:AcrR family transcriptional regulator